MSSLIQDTPFKTITIKELHPTFGAEVSGVDFDNLTAEQLGEIIAAMAKYGVCVFRSTGLTDSSHVSFSWKLGSLDNIGRYIGPGRKLRYQHLELFDAGNLDGDNNIISPDSPRAHSNRGNGLFHADSSFNPRRASFSLLRAVTIPPPETGGNTDFADSRTTFDDLPSHIKSNLLENDYVGAHCMAHSRKLGSPEFFAAVDPWKAPMSRHKIVQRHEPSGRYNLYIGAHLHHIEDREGRVVENSDELVSMLNQHATQPKYTMSVSWEREGDMVIWDNRCVLHRAGAWSGEGMYARDMRRTTVHDDSPTAWGLNEVGTAMP
ncbi:putative dichlorophenoxyacetate alpha-ketoglutarate dioxygenase, partial [Diplogelasinospora grovesii]